MPKRVYLVELKKKKVLVEASSQEAAIRAATAPMVKSCTIPTALEAARLMRDGIETIGESLEAKPPVEPQPPKENVEGVEDAEGVGRLGLGDAGTDGDDSGGQQSDGSC